jgi:hypothetical protein
MLWADIFLEGLQPVITFNWKLSIFTRGVHLTEGVPFTKGEGFISQIGVVHPIVGVNPTVVVHHGRGLSPRDYMFSRVLMHFRVNVGFYNLGVFHYLDSLDPTVSPIFSVSEAAQ